MRNLLPIKNQLMLSIPIEIFPLNRELGFPGSKMMRTTSHVNLSAFLVVRAMEMQVGVAGGIWTRVRVANNWPVSSPSKNKRRTANFAAI